MNNRKTQLVPKKNVDLAIGVAVELVKQLRLIRSGKPGPNLADPADTLNMYAEIMESGQTFEQVIDQFKTDLVIRMIERGHNTIKKLAAVLGKSPDATKVYISERKIRITEVRTRSI